MMGEQRQNLAVSGTHAWNQMGETIDTKLGPCRPRVSTLAYPAWGH